MQLPIFSLFYFDIIFVYLYLFHIYTLRLRIRIFKSFLLFYGVFMHFFGEHYSCFSVFLQYNPSSGKFDVEFLSNSGNWYILLHDHID